MDTQVQLSLYPVRPRGQLLKWVGNKFRYAHLIVGYLPEDYTTYIEPFVGTGAILATLSPRRAIAGDSLTPLIDLWLTVQARPQVLIDYYEQVISEFNLERLATYQRILRKYNSSPNGLDLAVLSRTCYGGVVRFTREGRMSTPIGPHRPVSPESFATRVREWRHRVSGAEFVNQSYAETMSMAKGGDLIYCDPPYVDSQQILYGSQDFHFSDLVAEIRRCKDRGVRIALSIDGKKKSGGKVVDLRIESGIFEREIYLDCGSSMLKRFQNGGDVMIGEDVHDRLLLTW